MQSGYFISFFNNLLFSKSFFYASLLIISLSNQTTAQINISKVSLNAGIIYNQQVGLGNISHRAFYPEAELGGLLYKNYFEWSISFGYWDDGVREPFPFMDYSTYSYSSLVLGGKIIFFPQNALEEFILPLHLKAGISYHHIKREYVGGEDFSGGYMPSQNYNVPAIDLGLGLNIKASKSLRLKLETDVYFAIDKSNSFPDNRGSASLVLGADYIF